MNKYILLLAIFILAACVKDSRVVDDGKDGAPNHIPVDIMAVPDAVPQYEKRTRAGNPVKYKVFGKQYKVLSDSIGYKKTGMASWYGSKFHGNKTANGEIYNMYAMTAAHKTLPIPSYARVTHLKNQRSVVVRINDRGPFHGNRIIDLSYTAAVKLGIQKTGTGLVEVTAVEAGGFEKSKQANLFYLQIGAFSSHSNAVKLQEKLMSRQISNSRIQVFQDQQGEIFKVQIGPLASVHQTEKLNEKLAQIGVHNTQIMIEK